MIMSTFIKNINSSLTAVSSSAVLNAIVTETSDRQNAIDTALLNFPTTSTVNNMINNSITSFVSVR